MNYQKKYIEKGKHKPYREDKIPKGNLHFISLNTHCGKEISRRDDIECLGYNLIFFMKGKLPWGQIKESDKIRQKKMDISLEELCEGLPEEFKEFIKYAKKLEFTQEPDYCYLKGLLLKAAEKNGIDIDKIKYDWDIKKEDERQKEKEEQKEEQKVKEEKETEVEIGDKKEEEKINKKEKETEEKENESKIRDKKEDEKEERKDIKENEPNNDSEPKTI